MIDQIVDPGLRDRIVLLVMLYTHVISVVIGYVFIFVLVGWHWLKSEMEIRKEIRRLNRSFQRLNPR